MAAEVPVAPAVAGRPRHGVPRRPLRDDPSRPDRRHGVGRRRLLPRCPPVQRRDRPALPRAGSTSSTGAWRWTACWVPGGGRDAASTTSTSEPCRATPSARSVGCTSGSGAGDRRVRSRHAPVVGAERRAPGARTCTRGGGVRARPGRGAGAVRAARGRWTSDTEAMASWT